LESIYLCGISSGLIYPGFKGEKAVVALDEDVIWLFQPLQECLRGLDKK
jgi:hypothetical protein